MSECYLSTAADDDAPHPSNEKQNVVSLLSLRRRGDAIRMQGFDVLRMLEGSRAGDVGFTGPGCVMTVNAALDALDAYRKLLVEVAAEVTPVRPLPVAKPFGRRVPDSALPATVSPARA